MGKYKDMPGIRILEETMRIAVGNGKRALLLDTLKTNLPARRMYEKAVSENLFYLLTRTLGHSLEYRMWKGD